MHPSWEGDDLSSSDLCGVEMIRFSRPRTMSKSALTLRHEWHWHRRIACPIDNADNAVGHRRRDSRFVPVVFHLHLELVMRHT